MILGAAQEGGSTRDAPVLLNNVLGTKFRVITGYPGTREILVAMERNEVQGVCGMGWDAIVQPAPAIGWSRASSACWCRRASPAMPLFDKMGVPKLDRLRENARRQRQIIELAYTQQAFGRPYLLPPGTPPDRVAALRKAFMAATQRSGAAGRGEEDARRGRPVVG